MIGEIADAQKVNQLLKSNMRPVTKLLSIHHINLKYKLFYIRKVFLVHDINLEYKLYYMRKVFT